MKIDKIWIVALVFVILSACNGKKETAESTDSTASAKKEIAIDPENSPVITFEESEFDFGDLKQGDEVKHIFKFKNTGKSNLIIETATAPCGCTVPSWPKEPIAPGESGEMEVKFNSTGKEGVQNKVVTVTANTVPTTSTVKIICNVVKK
jgi:hypothetical protein